MEGKITQYFADKLKTILSYPITLTKAVFDSDGNRLDEMLSVMASYEEDDAPIDIPVHDNTLAVGNNAEAKGEYSQAFGDNTIASGYASQVGGKYNIEDTTDKYAQIVGNGSVNSETEEVTRSNAYTLDWDGNAEFAGDVKNGNGLGLDGLNYSQTELKMLGWNVPKECSIQNVVNGNQFIQRVGRINIGSLSWNYDSGTKRFYTDVNGLKPAPAGNIMANVYIDKYTTTDNTTQAANLNNLTVAVNNSSSSVRIRNTDYTDPAAFKTAMNGVYLYYELTTSITKTIDGNEAVTQLNADLTELQKNNLGNGVQIEDRTETNKYTCPSDGYIRAYISRASTGYVRARIDSANENGNYIAISVFANTQDNAFNSVFVKKGMKVFVVSSVGDFTLRFIPLG